MTPHTRIAVRIPVTMKQQLATLARQRHVAMTDVVEAALQMVLTAESPPPSVARRLDRLLQEVRTLQQAVEVIEETLGLFINVYFSITPEVPPEHEEAARRMGGRRYARFLKILEGKLAREGRLFKGEKQHAPSAAPESSGAHA